MNNNTHPCAGKCGEFNKEGGQCFYCLINETVNRGVYSMHRTEHRIDHIVEPNDMVDANAGVTVITPKGTSKVKGGMAAFVDMGDDTHIENHISPLCKTESQPVLIVERDNQIIERLKVENVVLQAKVDELQAENKILHQAAATHLRNQNQFMDLYNRLVEQLYPYAIDLEDPVDGDVNTPKEYMDGYNRARECVHYNLLEMMKSDEEYICVQCDMLGGGGEV